MPSCPEPTKALSRSCEALISATVLYFQGESFAPSAAAPFGSPLVTAETMST